MNVFNELSALPNWEKTIITVGSFDGLHKGHQTLLSYMLDIAEQEHAIPVLITFNPHPREVIFPALHTTLLQSPEEKLKRLSTTGIPNVVIVPFTSSFANLSAEDYIRDFLVSTFKPSIIFLGHDHHFGKDREGNLEMLESRSPYYGYKVNRISAYLMDEIAVSSSRIRDLIHKGEMTGAARLLGYPYQLEGCVIKGDQIGRTMGFPTANLELTFSKKLLPGDGVYAVFIQIDNSSSMYRGMMNIGVRPTLEGKKHQIETHLFDFNQDIYGRKIQVIVIERIRKEQKFNNLEELQWQLSRDRQTALQILNKTNPLKS
jgi:riboflavin kinase/FMN adenylyltransferase